MTDTIETTRDWHGHWSTVGERVGPLDFFQQVERTIGGRPVDDLQIALVVAATCEGLDLQRSDVLLDLCCGNGLVTTRFSAHCAQVLGVDFSTTLIEVARQHHAPANVTYLHGSATELTPAQLGGVRPTKIAMCTALQYFAERDVAALMRALGSLGAATAPVYFTDVPDVDHLYDFYDTPERRADYERRKAAGTEAVGTWWSRIRLAEILRGAGYATSIKPQDSRRFGAHYRFDVLARPAVVDPRPLRG
jgi:cyclopropane fatty-acyl-phospholipid synthase-like methyltransferase